MRFRLPNISIISAKFQVCNSIPLGGDVVTSQGRIIKTRSALGLRKPILYYGTQMHGL